MKYGAMSLAVSSRLLSAPYLVAMCGVMEVYFHVLLTTTYMEMVVNIASYERSTLGHNSHKPIEQNIRGGGQILFGPCLC